ncbi:hypothetical protein A11A3_06808 [Alcanivorax hongdengensis A-11-3]|uniref:Transmembrane protein n=1 Tax=Alcanivorax hongdengensis A-11-3 TaxID=1177179 RepID=L0WEX1_9GAMM|nr:hypothetical protein [Alcanivorax hongdengensis]EKF74712.1 hypothetical protein A11A3_06808 [Alcanivorax hongdengensis A-11-3]
MDVRLLNHLFRVLVGLMVPTLAGLWVLDAPLHNSTSPLGIVSFELCGWQDNCQDMLRRWSERERLGLMVLQGLDYLFLLLYPAVIAVALLRLLGREASRGLLPVVIGLAVLMGLADAVENYGLIRMVLEMRAHPFDVLASTAATLKFALLLFMLGWLLLLVGRALLARR